MRATFRASQATGAAKLATGVDGVNIGYGNIEFIEVFDDAGKSLFVRNDQGASVPPPPVVTPPTKLEVLYFAGDAGDPGEVVKAAVAAVKPEYQVFCDSLDGSQPKLQGSGDKTPAIQYVTAENKLIVRCYNPDHPYFGGARTSAAHVDAMVKEAPALKAAIDAGTDPTKLWDTAWSTLDPRSETTLLYAIQGGPEATAAAAKYRSIFYLRYPTGKTPGINNPETDAGDIADTEAKRQAFANMLTAEEKALYLTPGK